MSIETGRVPELGPVSIKCDYGCGEVIYGPTVEAAEGYARDLGWLFIHCREDGKTYHYCRTCASEGV